MQTSVQGISSIVILVVTVINTVYGSPIWNALNGAPPTFVKPLVLPASFSRSTLSNELLNLLKQSRANSMPANRPDPPSVSRPPASASPSPETAVTATPSRPRARPFQLSEADMVDERIRERDYWPPVAASDRPSGGGDVVDSQLDRPPSDAADGRADPNSTPVLASFTLPPETPCDDAQTAAGPNTTTTTTSAPPFPGPTLLPIQPLNLPPKFNSELVRLLSDSAQTSPSQEPAPDASLPYPPGSAPAPNSAPPAADASAPPLCPPGAASRPLPAVPPGQSSRQLLNLLLSSPATVQTLKSLLGCTAAPAHSGPTSVPTSWPSCQTSVPRPSLNLAFLKYLSTIPRCLSRQ